MKHIFESTIHPVKIAYYIMIKLELLNKVSVCVTGIISKHFNMKNVPFHSTGKQKLCHNLAFVHVMVKTYRFDN